MVLQAVTLKLKSKNVSSIPILKGNSRSVSSAWETIEQIEKKNIVENILNIALRFVSSLHFQYLKHDSRHILK